MIRLSDMDNFSAVKIKTIIFINEYFVQKYINLLKENKNYKVSETVCILNKFIIVQNQMEYDSHGKWNGIKKVIAEGRVK